LTQTRPESGPETPGSSRYSFPAFRDDPLLTGTGSMPRIDPGQPWVTAPADSVADRLAALSWELEADDPESWSPAPRRDDRYELGLEDLGGVAKPGGPSTGPIAAIGPATAPPDVRLDGGHHPFGHPAPAPHPAPPAAPARPPRPAPQPAPAPPPAVSARRQTTWAGPLPVPAAAPVTSPSLAPLPGPAPVPGAAPAPQPDAWLTAEGPSWIEAPDRVPGGRVTGGRVAARMATAEPARDLDDEDEIDAAPPRHLVSGGARRRASWREDLVTGICGGVLVLGVTLDGWSHFHGGGDNQPVMSRWHLLMYAGFAATALWLLTLHQVRRAWRLAVVPPGYRAGLAGVGLAIVAVAGDAVWQSVMGAGLGVTRLTGPFRLLLLLGAAILVSSGYRAAWGGPSPARGLSLRAFSPILLSLIWVTTILGFLFQYASPYVAWDRPGFDGFRYGSPEWDLVAISALFTVLVTNLIFVAPVMLTLRRWSPPFGTVTIMFGTVGLLNAGMTGFSLAGTVAAALAGGLAADVAINRWPPSPAHPKRLRAVAVATSVTYWAAYFAVLAVGYGRAWQPGLWVGSIALAALSGWILAVLMQPAPVPAAAWQGGEDTPAVPARTARRA
jgi:hypothetical protein